ncbi:MAG TPA: O-antigen ligase family protein [Verrucomicrobiota bacterium]|nr:O-antigen ligase family protein [Verrucomicrobiota bacterium]HNU51946.1 O-antigen ligase family protein [Verrucomicrobiota bacterium]
MPKEPERSRASSALAGRWFVVSAGLLLGLAAVKFGNPVILDSLIKPPSNLLEYVFQPWPVTWGYWLLAGVTVLGLAASNWSRPRSWWVVGCLGLWWLWQWVAATGSVDAGLTRVVLGHFTGNVVWFILGALALTRVDRPGVFWVGPWLGVAFVMWTALEQHFGGLEATRQMVFSQPGWEQLTPEQIKRLQSDRVFGTLLYPNTLAGLLLFWTPALSLVTWRAPVRLTPASRGLISGLILLSGMACLYWSGSKAGWLIAVVLVCVGLWHVEAVRRWRWWIVVGIVGLGTTGLVLRHGDYFRRGALSVGARFDYWHVAVQTALTHPVVGTGPGTFMVIYRKLKPPEAEMARLVHNDYLQQGSDSGLAGFLGYGAFVGMAVAGAYRRCREEPLRFAVWLGLLAWALQGGVEFGLYIPAISWPAFAVLGWLWGPGEGVKAIDKGEASG